MQAPLQSCGAANEKSSEEVLASKFLLVSGTVFVSHVLHFRISVMIYCGEKQHFIKLSTGKEFWLFSCTDVSHGKRAGGWSGVQYFCALFLCPKP
jgi:hypothetical protein